MTLIPNRPTLIEKIKSFKYYLLTASVFTIIGYNLNFKEPKIIVKTEYIQREETNESEKSSATGTKKYKETKADGSVIEAEESYSLDLERFYAHRAELHLKQEIQIPAEPNWLVGVSTALEWGDLKPTYGVSFGGKIKLIKDSYWVAEVWPIEKRLEATYIRALK
jgi:hypothetical protein